jgi:hypothetical protein
MACDVDPDSGPPFIKINRLARGDVVRSVSGCGEDLHLDRVPIVFS